jgi:hypothetical protein
LFIKISVFGSAQVPQAEFINLFIYEAWDYRSVFGFGSMGQSHVKGGLHKA